VVTEGSVIGIVDSKYAALLKIRVILAHVIAVELAHVRIDGGLLQLNFCALISFFYIDYI